MKTLISKFSKVTLLTFILTFTFISAYSACDNPAFTEGADRSYTAGDIISRSGKDYKVMVAGWANTTGSDWAYAPGTGSNWTQAWSLEKDPCTDTGGGGATCSDGIMNQDETGVDCGGASCTACGVAATCSDGIMNQDETGIDCGGASCTACGVSATCSDGIMNQDETGVDCGGASCSACPGGGGGGNGQACTVTADDGLAQATYYTLLETGASSIVTCSFDAVADIKGTFYGALETASLHGPGGSTPAVYCGMCVSMTGINGTHTVQVTDECPDCHEHNSGNTDIDLSTPAFAAVVGDQSIGRSNITWSEIPCPWTSPLQVIIQGSNEWSAKVIIANHVNRIAKVEVMWQGAWSPMTRGVDNGWNKGSMNGTSKDFKITDIYGEEITVTGLDFTANPTNSKNFATGAKTNFTKCGVATSADDVNSINYVSVYPNPAENSITLEGLDYVQSLQVVNLNGQVVLTQQLGGEVSTAGIDISGLASGIYVVKLVGANTSSIVKFIKK